MITPKDQKRKSEKGERRRKGREEEGEVRQREK